MQQMHTSPGQTVAAVRAHQLVAKAKQNGELVPQPCARCGATPFGAHHEDYSKPLEVVWLCKKCHVARHLELGWGLKRSGGVGTKALIVFADDTPLRISELAAYMRLGRTAIYDDVSRGYVFEFATKKMTTAGHYKRWLRVQTFQIERRRTNSKRK